MNVASQELRGNPETAGPVRMGLAITHSIGGNAKPVRLSGVLTKKVGIATFTISGVAAGVR